MARLPTVGGDAGNWGDVLNDYLSQSHNADGSLKSDSVGAPQLRPNSVTTAAIGDGQVTNSKVADAAVGTSQLSDGAVTNAKLAGAGAANGVATLDEDAKLSEAQVPQRLETGMLDARFARNSDPLAPWRQALQERPATAKIATVGDSTRDSAAAGVNWHNSLKRHMVPGAGLEGFTPSNLLNFGFNGATVQVITGQANMTSLAAAAPDLVEFSMGINNVRATAVDTNALEAILVAGIEAIRAAVPGTPLVGSIPNPFNTVDAGAGYVSPNSEAQAKSTILRNAYLRLVGRWPDVVIRDTAEVFGTVSQSSSPYLSDQIHPSAAGTDASSDGFVALVGRVLPRVRALAAAARSTNPYDPWTAYGREVEDTERYVLVGEGLYINSGVGSYVDFDYPYLATTKFRHRDLVEMPDGQVFVKTNDTVSSPGANRTRILSSSVPAFTLPSGSRTGVAKVRVWRRKVAVRTALDGVLRDDRTWGFKQIGWVATAATGSATPGQRVIDIQAGSLTATAPTADSNAWPVQAGDRLYIDGLTETDGADYLTLGTSGNIGTSGSNFRLDSVSQITRDSLRYRLAVIVGPAR